MIYSNLYALTASFILLASAGRESTQATTVFRGVPSVKIAEQGVERSVDRLNAQSAGSSVVVVSRIGGKYYWASRENTELTRIQAGAFITYVALNGSGYIRIIMPTMKKNAAMMSPTESQFDYVEHLTIGLRTISYFGTTRSVQ